jgi:FAD/FMN-containing dehydrogenase
LPCEKSDWQKRIPQRFPDVIVAATSDADVIEAVKVARARGLLISVRAGGNSWIATSLRDGGMLIDLSRLNRVTVDVAARTATAQPAIKNTELVAALAQHGWRSRPGIAQPLLLAAIC